MGKKMGGLYQQNMVLVISYQMMQLVYYFNDSTKIILDPTGHPFRLYGKKI